MSKYTEKDVLKIKRDIERYSGILTDLLNKVDEAEDSVKSKISDLNKMVGSLNLQIIQKQSSLDELQLEINNLENRFSQRKSKMISDINYLEEIYQKLKNRVIILRDENLKLDKEHADTQNYFASASKMINRDLTASFELLSKTKQERDQLEKEQARLLDSITKLSSERKLLEDKIDILDSEINDKSGNVESLFKERKQLLATLDEIKNRERDVRVLEHRLSKEYLVVYNSLPNRKTKYGLRN